MTDRIATHWDPFSGKRSAVRETVADPGEGMKVPGWITTGLLLLSLFATVGLVATLVWPGLAWFAVPALCISIGGIIGIEILKKSGKKRDWRFYQLAEKNGWSFKLIAPERQSKRNGRTIIEVDPLATSVYEKIGVLCRPRPGQLIPLKLQAMYWGDTPGGMPFWLGLQEFEVDATMAMEALKKDGFGNRGLQGKLFNLVVAYRLERDTGIVATLLAEPLDRDGWLDAKTESSEFNNRFKIAVEPASGSFEDPALALLRALTPATQASLIALDDRYRLQMMIDGETVFFSGTDRIMSEDEAAIGRHFAELVNQFSEAAVSFKHYVE